MAEEEKPQAAILTESLTKIYDRKQIALHCVDLSIEPGTVLGLLGPNGAGKTTLIKLLLGLHVPTAGRVYIFGQRMTPNSAALRRRIGYLPADPKFPPSMTPIDYLDYVGRLSGLPRSARRPRLASLLRAVDLLRTSGQPIKRFSTGMKTRLAIAASLINDPDILIWDEPSQGLDPEARRGILNLMKNMAESKTLILSSHHLDDIHEVCNQAIVLHEGQVIYSGDLDQLKGSVKPSPIEITLSGDKKEMAEAHRKLTELDDLSECTLRRNVLHFAIRDNASHTTAMANVMVTLADHSIEMAGLRVCGQETEQALVNLIQEEGTRGFSRAHQSADH